MDRRTRTGLGGRRRRAPSTCGPKVRALILDNDWTPRATMPGFAGLPMRLALAAVWWAAAGCGGATQGGSATVPFEVDQPIFAAAPDPAANNQVAVTDPALPQGQEPGDAPDTLTAILSGILEELDRIGRRLDSMDARTDGGGPGSVGPPAPAPDTAETGPAGIDLEGARDEVRSLGVGIFWSLVVIVVFHFAIRLLIWVLETLAERSATRRLTFKWLIPITRMLLWAVAAYFIVRAIFQIDAQGLLAAGAALGVALGFAAQDLLKNVFGGLIVVFDQPFQVGDKISVGGTYGEVVSIGLRSTRIVTADDNLVTVPNSQVVQEQVANANAGELNCQVLTNLHLPGQVDEHLAKKIAFDAAVTSPYVFLGKPIGVLIEDEFRTTFVTRIKVRAYVLDPRFEFRFQSDITERARDGYRRAKLTATHDWAPRPYPVDAPSA